MAPSAETKPGFSRKHLLIALVLGLLLLGGIGAGAAYVLRPPKPKMSDLADLNEDPAPTQPPANAADPTAPAATQADNRIRFRRPVALTEADGVYKRSETRMDFIAKTAVMTVNTPASGKYTFAYSYRPSQRTDALYGLVARMVRDPASYPEVTVSAEQIARINAIPTDWVFPDSDRSILEDLFRTYATTPDGAAKDAAKADLLAKLGAAGERASADLQGRLIGRATVLTPEQILKCRVILNNPRQRPRPGGGGGAAIPMGVQNAVPATAPANSNLP